MAKVGPTKTPSSIPGRINRESMTAGVPARHTPIQNGALTTRPRVTTRTRQASSLRESVSANRPPP
jgi:hypothetical protein